MRSPRDAAARVRAIRLHTLPVTLVMAAVGVTCRSQRSCGKAVMPLWYAASPATHCPTKHSGTALRTEVAECDTEGLSSNSRGGGLLFWIFWISTRHQTTSHRRKTVSTIVNRPQNNSTQFEGIPELCLNRKRPIRNSGGVHLTVQWFQRMALLRFQTSLNS